MLKTIKYARHLHCYKTQQSHRSYFQNLTVLGYFWILDALAEIIVKVRYILSVRKY